MTPRGSTSKYKIEISSEYKDRLTLCSYPEGHRVTTRTIQDINSNINKGDWKLVSQKNKGRFSIH